MNPWDARERKIRDMRAEWAAYRIEDSGLRAERREPRGDCGDVVEAASPTKLDQRLWLIHGP